MTQSGDKSPQSKALRAICVVLVLFTVALNAEDKTLPDPAAHTVLVPFDPAKPLTGQKPRRFYLDRAEFDRLWALAKKNRTPEKVVEKDDEAPSATLHSALYRAGIEDERLSIEAVYEVATRGHWAKTNLGINDDAGPLPPRDLIVDGRPGAMEKGEVTFEQPGRHTVQVTFDLVRPRNWKQAAVTLPSARAAMLSLRPAAQDAMPVFADSKLIAVEENTGGTRTITVGLGSSTVLKFDRVQRRTVSDAPPPSAELSITTSLTGEMRLHGVVNARFVFPGSARKEVALTIDPAWSLDGVPGVSSGGSPVRDMRVSFRDEAGKPTLVAAFPYEVSDEVTLDLHLTPKSMTLTHTPAITPRAAKWESTARLIAQDGVQLIARPTAAQQRLPNESYRYNNQDIPVVRYRLSGSDTLAFETQPADSKSEALIEYAYQLSEQKQELAAAITLKRERGAWRQLRLTLPAGMEMQSVQSPQLSAWELEGSQLFLRFNDATGTTAKVVVYVANASLKPTQAWAIKPLILADMGKVRGNALIAAHAAVEARLEGFLQTHDLREVDPGTLNTTFSIKTPLEKKRAIEFERADWALNVSVQEQPVRFVVDGVMLTQATDAGVLLSQQLAITVEAGALKRVIVRLPKALPEATVSGELLRESQSRIAGEQREYECTFQSQGGLLGATALTFDMQLPITDAELAVPFVDVQDAERLRRFFVLDNLSSRESRIVQTDGVDTCAKDSLPYVPDVVTQPQYFQGRPAGGLKVAFGQLQASGGNAAIVTLADITTVLRADGERWETVVYSLSNRSLQFLPVVLPDKAELIAVSVTGEPVRADEEQRQGRRVRLIPLIQTRAGQRSMDVRMVYRIKGSDQSRKVKLDDPELVGISAERTVWTASLPKGWTLDDTELDTYGNMEPIPEEGKEIERLQSWMSDLSRLNRRLSSSSDVYENKATLKEAEKLNKQIDDLYSKVESKQHRDWYSRGSDQEKAQREQRFVTKTENDLGQVKEELSKQVVVLNGNRDNNTRLEKQQVNAITVQRRNGVADMEMGNGRLLNTWSFNGIGKKESSTRGDDLPASGMFVDLNDNVAVASQFFEPTLTLTGANTYTGATVVNGGTISGTGRALIKTGGGTMALDAPQQAQLTSNNIQQPVFNSTNAFGVNSNARASGSNGASLTLNNSSGTAVAAGNASIANVTSGGAVAITGSNTFTGTTTAGMDAFGNGTMAGRGVAFGGTMSAGQLPRVQRATPVSQDDKVAEMLKEDAAKARRDLGLAAVPAPAAVASPAPATPGLMAPADPFAAPATANVTMTGTTTLATGTSAPSGPMGGKVILGAEMKPNEVTVARATADGAVNLVTGQIQAAGPGDAGNASLRGNADNDDITTAAVNQLRPTGRRSLQVAVPVGGEVFHFRKLKDHAVLDLTLQRVTPAGRTVEAAFLGISLGIWVVLALFVSRRKK